MRMKTPKDVGYYIASTRKALKWSQSELAIKIGKDQRFVSKVENDPASVSFGTVLMVLNVLNIHVDLHSLLTTNSQPPHKLAKSEAMVGGQATHKVPHKASNSPLRRSESGDLFSPSKKKPVIVSKPNVGKK